MRRASLVVATILFSGCALGDGLAPASTSSTTTTVAATTPTTSSTTATISSTAPPTTTTAPPTTTTPPATSVPAEPLATLARAVMLPGVPGTDLDDATADFLAEGGAGIFLLGFNIESAAGLRSLTSEAACAASGPILVAVDHELSPAVQRLRGLVSPIPGPEEAVAAGADDVEEAAARLGSEMLDLGVNVNLAPVIDVVAGANPVLDGRHLGPDPEVVAEIGAAFARGMAAAGVVAVPKHFPGHGRSVSDPHGGGVIIDASTADLSDRDWPPFERVIAEGAGAIMIGHPVYLAIDPDSPASLSPVVLDLLRATFGFDGVAITDSLSMAGVAEGRTPGAVAVAALAAGEDLLLVQDPRRRDETLAAIVAAVEAGDLTRDRLEEAAGRVRALAAAAGQVTCNR
jgi:beta-N-acetylhexosaminidase